MKQVTRTEALLGPLSPPGKQGQSCKPWGRMPGVPLCVIWLPTFRGSKLPTGLNTPTPMFLKRRCDSQVTLLPSKKCKSQQLQESASLFPPSPGKRREGPCSSLGAGGPVLIFQQNTSFSPCGQPALGHLRRENAGWKCADLRETRVWTTVNLRLSSGTSWR